MTRYLIHMDDPDKAPYSPEDVLEFNGADWKKIAPVEGNQSDAMSIVKLVEEKRIHGYFDLLKACEADHPDLLEFETKQVTFCRESHLELLELVFRITEGGPSWKSLNGILSSSSSTPQLSKACSKLAVPKLI